MQEQIELAAKRATCLTRTEYDTEGLNEIVCYDLARQAAQDCGYVLCVNIDIDPVPTNVGAALLKMIDDKRALQGLPRRHQHAYCPRIIAN